MTKDEALKLALEALEDFLRPLDADLTLAIKRIEQKTRIAITAIKEALAQPEQEPVAFYVYKPTLPRGNLGNVSDGDLPWVYDQDPSSGYSARMLVYTAPPQRKPLTDEQIEDEWERLTGHSIFGGDRAEGRAMYLSPDEVTEFARAIESAHGIKE